MHFEWVYFLRTDPLFLIPQGLVLGEKGTTSRVEDLVGHSLRSASVQGLGPMADLFNRVNLKFVKKMLKVGSWYLV